MVYASARRARGAALAALVAAPVAAGPWRRPPANVSLARRHLISLRDDGRPHRKGRWGQTAAQIREVVLAPTRPAAGPPATVRKDGRFVFSPRPPPPPPGVPPRLLFYAHGGMTTEAVGLTHIEQLRDAFRGTGVHPAVFVWRTDLASTLANLFRRGRKARRRVRRPAGRGETGDETELFDRFIERTARRLGVGAIWAEMKENARLASEHPAGGARAAAAAIAEYRARVPGGEVHLAGHSAGSILLGHLLAHLRAGGAGPAARRVDSVTLIAPACTVAFFREVYLPALRDGSLGRLRIFNLDDAHERDVLQYGGVYHKSVLYLVKNAFEAAVPTPLLGMATAFAEDPALQALVDDGTIEVVTAPNDLPLGHPAASGGTDHKTFGHDPKTIAAIRAAILVGDPPQ